MDVKIKNFVKRLSLTQKLLILLAIMIVIRIGSLVRLPFVNADYMKALLGGNSLGVLSILTGNSLTEMGFFALSISPYISASIIIQLLTVVFPALEEMAKDGKTGQEKYKRVIRYTGIGLALLQALAMAIGFGKSGLIEPFSALTVIAATITWTIGASILIGIGEFIDLFNIGSGVSMLLFLNIVSTIPNDVKAVYDMYVAGRSVAKATVSVIIAVAISLAVLYVCTLLNSAEKRLTLTTSRRVASYGNTNNNSIMPIPFLTCSVMPVIFASSIMSVPVIISRFVPSMQNGFIGKIVNSMSQGQWFNPEHPLRTLGAIFYVLLTFFFTYFYLSIQYNPAEIANNLKKSGTLISGVRPGKPTADYIEKVTIKVALVGNACLVAVILVTACITNFLGFSNLALGGTSAIIAVSVVNDVRNKLSAEFASRKVYSKSAKSLFAAKRARRKVAL